MSDSRFTKLEQELNALKVRVADDIEHIRPTKPEPKNNSAALGYRIVAEMIAGVGLGVIVALFLDNQFQAGALGYVVCLFLGVIGGLYNVIKLALRMNDKPKAPNENSNSKDLDPS